MEDLEFCRLACHTIQEIIFENRARTYRYRYISDGLFKQCRMLKYDTAGTHVSAIHLAQNVFSACLDDDACAETANFWFELWRDKNVGATISPLSNQMGIGSRAAKYHSLNSYKYVYRKKGSPTSSIATT